MSSSRNLFINTIPNEDIQHPDRKYNIPYCIFATNAGDLNQTWRSLTSFNAKLTILVMLDSTGTQKKTELWQKEFRMKLAEIKELLLDLQQSQNITEAQ